MNVGCTFQHSAMSPSNGCKRADIGGCNRRRRVAGVAHTERVSVTHCPVGELGRVLGRERRQHRVVRRHRHPRAAAEFVPDDTRVLVAEEHRLDGWVSRVAWVRDRVGPARRTYEVFTGTHPEEDSAKGTNARTHAAGPLTPILGPVHRRFAETSAYPGHPPVTFAIRNTQHTSQHAARHTARPPAQEGRNTSTRHTTRSHHNATQHNTSQHDVTSPRSTSHSITSDHHTSPHDTISTQHNTTPHDIISTQHNITRHITRRRHISRDR